MIKEAYVSLETAKLLKEKGFDEGCSFIVNTISKGVMPVSWPITNSDLEDKEANLIALPTQQMAMRWLREVHNIKVNIFYNNSNYTIEYFEPNTQTGVGKFVFIGDGYNVYEQACETAIKYCLENLI